MGGWGVSRRKANNRAPCGPQSSSKRVTNERNTIDCGCLPVVLCRLYGLCFLSSNRFWCSGSRISRKDLRWMPRAKISPDAFQMTLSEWTTKNVLFDTERKGVCPDMKPPRTLSVRTILPSSHCRPVSSNQYMQCWKMHPLPPQHGDTVRQHLHKTSTSTASISGGASIHAVEVY